MAELGCSAGRMTWSFAQRFQSATGVDISAGMQSRAKFFPSPQSLTIKVDEYLFTRAAALTTSVILTKLLTD